MFVMLIIFIIYSFDKFSRQQKKTRSDKFVKGDGSGHVESDLELDTEKTVDHVNAARAPRKKYTKPKGVGTSTVYSLRINPDILSLTPGENVYGPIHIPTHLFDPNRNNSNKHENENENCDTPNRQYIRISIAGKFFLFNQIRIMLGSALAVHHGILPQNTVENALSHWDSDNGVDDKPLPIIPAECLICLDCGFDRNKGGKVSFESFVIKLMVYTKLD